MAFWGIEVKPGKPVTHSCDKGRRLRISQATLGISEATKKTVVQCNVGKRAPVLLCALLPNKTESCHLDLEFEEADDVVFSVIGPRSVYLTGYFVCQIPHLNSHSDSESYGVDIENTQTEGSSYCSDDDKYEDSFINDDEMQVSPLSPDLGNKDDVPLENDKVNERKGPGKQLKKKFRIIESDDDVHSCENEAEDGNTSSVSKDKRTANTSLSDAEEEVAGLAETGNEAKANDGSGEQKREIDPLDINDKVARSINLSLDEEGANIENKMNDLLNPEEAQIIEEIITSNEDALTDDIFQRNNVKDGTIDQNLSPTNIKDQMQFHDLARPKKKRKQRSMREEKTIEFQIDNKDHNILIKDKDHGVEASADLETDMNCAVTLMEMSTLSDKEMKRRKTEHPEGPQTGIVDKCHHLPKDGVAMILPQLDGDAKDPPTANGKCQEQQVSKGTSMDGIDAKLNSMPKEEKIVSDLLHHDLMTMEMPAANTECQEQQIDNDISINSKSLANDSQPDKKSKRKKKKSRGKQDLNMGLPLTTNDEEIKFVKGEVEATNETPIQRKTLSNGLIIEELASGPPDGKVAAPGKKVKIYYSGMLKDNGFVFDSNVGKAGFRFQLGDEDYINGWNMGIDGMHVGDKRRLIIPPSMGFGNLGVGKDVPPNSWLIYDIELLSVRSSVQTMSETSCNSMSNSTRTYYCGEIARFTSRTTINPGRKFYKCPKLKNALIEINDLKAKLEVTTIKMESLRELLNAIQLERDNLKKKLDVLEGINCAEVNKSRNLEDKLLKMKMFIIPFAAFVGFLIAKLK